MIYATEKIDLYAKYIAMIMMGANVPNAAILCGISRGQLSVWKTEGLADLAEGRDTIYSRYINDLNVACMVPTIDAETRIQNKDPLEWLRSGPGRHVSVLNNENTWQPLTAKIAIVEPPGDAVGIAEQRSNTVEDEGDLYADAPTVQDMPEALEVMRQVGLGRFITQSPSEDDQALDEAKNDSSEAVKEELEASNGKSLAKQAAMKESDSASHPETPPRRDFFSGGRNGKSTSNGKE